MDNTEPTPIPPIICQPWCELNNGHTEARIPEDQCCNGVEHRVGLHLHELVNYTGAGEGSDWHHDYLTVYATKAFSRDPAVFVGRGESAGTDLTHPRRALSLNGCGSAWHR
jgi:hypothetical protein